MHRYVGVDAGGSNTRWVVVDDDESELAVGQAPSVQAAVLGVAESARRLSAVLQIAADGAGASLTAAVLGVAGAGDPLVRAALERALRPGFPVVVTGDCELGAARALADGPGLLVWSGTGSFVVGRDRDGDLHRVGGRGHLLGDEGSAYDLVRRAAASVVMAHDRDRGGGALEGALVAHFGAASPAALGARMQQLMVTEIAAALPVIGEAAAAGDDRALTALAEGARDLAGTAAALAARIGRAPVRVGGGAVEHCQPWARALARALEAEGFVDIAPCPPGGNAHGAARLARARALGLEPLCHWIGDGPTA